MSYKLVQMCLRGFTFALMLLGLYFHWESSDLTTTIHFIMSGVYGGIAIGTLGFLIEAGLDLSSDRLIEATFLVTGASMNLLCAVLSFVEFYAYGNMLIDQSINKGFVSVLSVVLYLMDLLLVYCA